ncbi:MAG TPA: TonB-dependent receptor [Candidatus Acidoferrum sp.]|nr:TonB-dependent receptor [Candidatus Acidoferrum sp.]
MRKFGPYWLAAALFLLCGVARATVFGSIRGIVHDPQHRPIQGATVTVKAKASDWTKSATTDANGEFLLNAAPIGEYVVTVTSSGFSPAEQDVVVESGTEPILHVPLSVAGKNETVTVSGVTEVQPTDSATPTTLVSREDIEQTPGADLTNSLAMITDYVPGAYVTHDMLHMRGGHQTTWLLDGVPVINTAIAVNVGPQFDPQDIDYLEVNRGSYGAEYGDRTYGVFNVVPRTGFERNNEAELTLSAGNFYQTDAHLSFGSHTERFAYYASVNGNRSDFGLEPPVPDPVHDAANGIGGFGSLIFNVSPSNQLRLVTSLRRDYYQIPYDPDPNDIENGSIPENGFTPQWPSIGLRDSQREADAGVIFSWVHTFSPHLLTTISPFYHYNSGNYASSPNDVPVATTEDRGSTYAGGQATVQADFARNNLQAGFFSFYERDNQTFGAIFNDGSGNAPISDVERPDADLETFFIDDKFQPFSWMTFSAGMRPTRFSGNYANGVSETSISPRFGATFTVPRLRWTFRAFYGHYYQAPPLETASGPALMDFAQGQGLTFIPLHGESDEERQFGVTVPLRGWVLDADNFRTNVRNFLDHNNIGASSIFFPITVDHAVIRGWELTLRSPLVAHRARLHLSYSNQIAEGDGTITGGLTDFGVFPDFEPLDHDQRNTLNLGGEVTLPWRSYAATNVYYGSGFTNGYPGQPYPGNYLPGHTTFDLSVGKNFGERFSASLNALNVANRRVELDNSLTFGGFHWNQPRQIYVEIRYRFHY